MPSRARFRRRFGRCGLRRSGSGRGLCTLRFLCFKSLFFCIQSCLIRREFVSLTLQLHLLLLILKLPDPVVQSLNLSRVILLLVT